jgi:predicted dienelactone hydrolase
MGKQQMQELGILIFLAVFFLFLSLVRPLIKDLWTIEGLSVLPLPALGIIAAIFPAYGFRPECIPLLVYAIILNITNIPVLVSLFKPQNDNFLERSAVFTVFALGLLFLSSGTAFLFLPRGDADPAGVRVVTVQDQSRSAEFFIRIYAPELSPDEPAENRPLMILVPPVMGSVMMTDRLSGALAGRGFTVMSYSRRGFDSPAAGENGRKYHLSPGKNAAILRALTTGTRSETANRIGRSLETERIADIRFLLSLIGRNTALGALFSGTVPDCVFLTGYGAGGAALVSIAASPGFAGNYPEVRGIIAVESPLLSILEREKEEPPEHPSPRVWAGIKDWFISLGVKKISRIAAVPRPQVPVFFLVSDRIQDPRHRDDRYASILRTLHGSAESMLLAAVPGAGPLDYSDCPEKYPLYSVLFPGGGRDIWKNETFIGGTASLMANFAAMVLAKQADPVNPIDPIEQTDPESARVRISPPARTSLDRNIYIETGGTWNLPESGYILGP